MKLFRSIWRIIASRSMCGRIESGGGPPHSKTLARWPRSLRLPPGFGVCPCGALDFPGKFMVRPKKPGPVIKMLEAPWATIYRAGLVTMAITLAGSAPAQARSTEFSFATRIVPVLTKAGCNTGACHGAATGQGGFKLSLLGYDPEQDHEAITREFGGRRIDLGAPGQSLLLRKPTRQLEHEGGRRIQRDSDAYRTLVGWIAEGAPYGSRVAHVIRIEIKPAGGLLLKPARSHPLKVTAHLS